MDVQAIFYTMGIIFMSVMFLFMVAIIILIFYIKNKITQLERGIRQKLELASTVTEVGGKAVEAAVGKLRDFVERKSMKAYAQLLQKTSLNYQG